jgi:hypothetical protein
VVAAAVWIAPEMVQQAARVVVVVGYIRQHQEQAVQVIHRLNLHLKEIQAAMDLQIRLVHQTVLAAVVVLAPTA